MTRILTLLACLLLAACGPATLAHIADGFAPPPPAPLAATTIDEKALTVAYTAYDGVLSLVGQRVYEGKLKGAQAAKVRAALGTAWTALNAASAAQKAGSATSYAAALANANTAIAETRKLLKGN